MRLSFLVCISLLTFGTLQAKELPAVQQAGAQGRIELLEYKLEAKLRELDLKEDNLELSKQNVADIINFHKEGVEDFHRTLNYLLVVMGIIVAIVTAVAGYVLQQYNQRKATELKKDVDALRISMQQSMDAITTETNRELDLIRAEAKKQMEHFKKG